MANRYHQGLFKPKNPSKYIGTLPIVFRSHWESKMFRYIDYHPAITKWSSESIIIPYINPVDNRPHRYFPDLWFEVTTKRGAVQTFLVEIKPHHQTQPPTTKPTTPRKYNKLLAEAATYAVNQAKFAAAKKFAEERHWTFVVLTEKDIFSSLFVIA